ncbi:FIST N-terminal domain-containing protein [uncultured Methanomethylovorans sp.]|uniref:FIST signal transduction protein n=1 Tax=uncultured Methanomethylovorans sp. TaxID=183759 RepID=UPI002AA95B40|nr:FIST N-terminal domain-containing protein [uncultured Methanomethylovorans sp.]
MVIKTAYSKKESVAEAVTEIKNSLNSSGVKMLMFFASAKYDPASISSKMASVFPGVNVIGCSTSGEIISGQMLKGSIVAMAFDNDIIEDIKVEIVTNLKEGVNTSKALASFEKYYGQKVSDLNYNKYLGFVLVDGLTCAEEELMDNIGNKTNVVFIGGSAGDDLKFAATQVYANGKVYNNAAVLALAKVKNGFDIIKTQSFRVMNKELVATKVDEKTREVIEFNHEPAAIAYSKALGVSVKELPEHFMHNPLGLMVDDEPFVRSPQAMAGNKVKFYCSIKEGMELSLLESMDIVEETAKDIEKKLAEIESASGMINFNCILRTLELENKGQCQKYADIFKKVPTIGFSTYGEQYVGHINQTATIAVFK